MLRTSPLYPSDVSSLFDSHIMLKAISRCTKRYKTCPQRCGPHCWSTCEAPKRITCRNRRRPTQKGYGNRDEDTLEAPPFAWDYLGLIKSLQEGALRHSNCAGFDWNLSVDPNLRFDSAGWTKRTTQTSRDSR